MGDYRYLFRLRRGWKYDQDPETGEPRDDWAEYEKQGEHVDPLAGELVLEYDNDVPRLKIGNGRDPFSKLPYMSVDSFILPKTAKVHIDSTQWRQAEDGDDDRFYQIVTVQNAVVTVNSKVDLNPSSDDLAIFHEKDLAFVAENHDGQIRIYCIGQTPKNSYTIPVTITEVVCDG